MQITDTKIASFLRIPSEFFVTEDELKIREKCYNNDLSSLSNSDIKTILNILNRYQVRQIRDDFLQIPSDFFKTEDEIKNKEKLQNTDLSRLSDSDIRQVLEVFNECQARQLRYIQEIFYSKINELIKTYTIIPDTLNLLNTNVATISYEMKYLLGSSIHTPNRVKANDSFLKNVKKEFFEKALAKLSVSSTKKDIQEIAQETFLAVSKDLYAATIIFHMANDMSAYCNKSPDSHVQLLFQQYKGIRDYLQPLKQQSKRVNISSTFIDGENNPNAPKEVKPLDLENIKTLEDYYNQKVALLTLLTNASMFEIPSIPNSEGKNRRIISELDLSSEDLVHLAKLSKPSPTNMDDYIDKILEIANKKILCKYIPFDEQLIKTLAEQDDKAKAGALKKPLDDTEKETYLIELKHLKDNLGALNGDRLYNYILQTQSDSIIKKPNDIEGFSIQSISKKMVSNPNGFFSIFNTLRINDLVNFELQIQDEFRANMSREHYSAHNAAIEGKSFDISHFFELVNPSHSAELNEKKLDKYRKFLNIIRHNDVKSARAKSIEKTEYEELLVRLVDYAESRISVKNSFEVGENNVPFLDYMNGIITFYCAKFGNIQANHSEGDHNTVAVKQSTIRETLFSFLKNRIGLSSLAFMIINKYDEQSLLQDDTEYPRASSGKYITISDSQQASRYIKHFYPPASNSTSTEMSQPESTFNPIINKPPYNDDEAR